MEIGQVVSGDPPPIKMAQTRHFGPQNGF